MKGDGGWVRARAGDQLTLLKVGQGALNGAARESRGGGEGLMRQADRPVGLHRGVTIEVQVENERGRAAVMAHHVGHEVIEQIRIKRYLSHKALWY